MGLTSKKLAIQKIQGVTEKQAEEILAEIKKEQTPKLDTTDIGMYGGE